MAKSNLAVRRIKFTYQDDNFIDDPPESYTVVIEELPDGSIRMFLNGEPANCSFEFMSNWAYNMNNWKTRISKDVRLMSTIDND